MFAFAAPLWGQWSQPTAGVPRTADGKPNLAAPAPRMADGKPDFSGTWDVDHNKPCPPGGCVDFYAPHEFGDIAWSLKDGLPFQPWARELAKKRTAEQRKDDPLSHCLPIGIVELQTIPMFRKMVHVPGLLAIIHEYNASYRQIFTDGRPMPEDPQPGWNGYSTAKWDGDTLVVQTTGFRDGIWLDVLGDPITDAAKVTERIRRPTFGRLEIELTVDDPKAYTKPWTIKLLQNLQLDTDLIDYVCLENEKDLNHFVVK
jgi:hypothetical protein